MAKTVPIRILATVIQVGELWTPYTTIMQV
jgi:hypothetical protein